MSLDYNSRLQKIEAVLQNALPSQPDSAWFRRNFFDFFNKECESPLVTPEKPLSLLEPGIDLLSRGGKRWRPLLMQLVCESLGGGDAALPLAPLVEFCHNASLIHDDIEDSSAERRGKPAVHLLYGTDTAINSGCFMYFLPLSCIDGWDAPAESKLKLYSMWACEMRALHLGQSLDIAWHRNWDSLPSIDDYYTMCALKTGVLARFAANTGRLARLAAGRSVESEGGAAFPLAKAAEKLGVGFQILDDVKNLQEGASGKRRGDDIVEGKKSLPVLLYLHGAASGMAETDRRRDLVMRCFATAVSGTAEAVAAIEELTSALNAAGCLDRAAERGHSLLAEADAAFSGFAAAYGSGNEACELLAGFTRLIG
ncbi:MAG: polyprenyl synthetase family protein [Spirochaetaceae bacterium]|jgi:octaprenyl-diphosphate synthase|nr:polyprenyl synthetase family protein [Spirochaetaceae bacterium]